MLLEIHEIRSVRALELINRLVVIADRHDERLFVVGKKLN